MDASGDEAEGHADEKIESVKRSADSGWLSGPTIMDIRKIPAPRIQKLLETCKQDPSYAAKFDSKHGRTPFDPFPFFAVVLIFVF